MQPPTMGTPGLVKESEGKVLTLSIDGTAVVLDDPVSDDGSEYQMWTLGKTLRDDFNDFTLFNPKSERYLTASSPNSTTAEGIIFHF